MNKINRHKTKNKKTKIRIIKTLLKNQNNSITQTLNFNKIIKTIF